MNVVIKSKLPEAAQSLLERFLLELESIYPAARDHTEVGVERDGTIWVRYPWPEDEDLHMEISEHMAKVATDIEVETDQYFMLVPTRELSPNGDETVRP